MLAPYRKKVDLENIGGLPKYWRISKMLADLQNVGAFQNVGGCTKCWRLPKYWQMYKMLASGRNIGGQ
jgi:hypothetical protein